MSGTRDVPASTGRAPSAQSESAAADAVGEKNLENVKNIVMMKTNPHPTTVILGFLTCLFVVYLFWLTTCSSSPRGTWVDDDSGKKYWIDYSKMTGTLSIWDNESGEVVYGGLRNYVLILGTEDSRKIGAWVDNDIFWTNADGQTQLWKRQLTSYRL